VGDIESMKADLIRAGWVEKTTRIWRAPNGALFLGPAGAWRALKRIQSVRDARDRETGRASLVQRWMSLRVEVEQIFTDCASRNDNARGPHEEEIDCDPDGKLRRIADDIDRLLSKEESRG
jgi:hypothetical protein